MRNLILSTLSTLALFIHPLSLSAQNSFSLSLDADGAAGDQAVTSLNTAPDQVVAIQIFGKDIQNANGLAVRFEYDASQVTYEGFDTGNVLPNAQALPEQGTNPTFVEIGIVSFGGQATVNSGLIGTVRFRTTAAFSDTAIRLVRAELGRGGQFESVTLDVRIALQGAPTPATFSLSLDVNGSTGDQAVTFANVSTDEVVAIQIFGKDILNANGVSIRFEYDASQMTYEGFNAGDMLPNAQALTEHGTNPTFVEIGIVSFGGQATANSGLIGTIRFRTMETFSSTAIQLVHAELGRGGQIEALTLSDNAIPIEFTIVLAKAQPVLDIEETKIDFGTIDAGKTAQQTFTIKNTGTGPLEITGIESNVSGLTFDITMFTLEPEGSQTVTITFPSSTEGTFSGSITISSNDPDRATQTLSVSVIVQAAPAPAITVQQTAIDFGTVAFAQPVQETITITNTGTAPLEITGIESDMSGLTFDTTMFTLELGGSQTVTVTFPSSVEGTFSGNITILSNDPDRAKHTVSVSVVVQAAPAPVLVVGETAVDFGTIDAEKTVQQTFTITNTGTALLEVAGIESDVSGLTFDPVMFTLAPDSSATITITFPKPMEGTFSGNITILSNDPDRATHTLTISGVVQPLSVEAKSDFDGNGIIDFADFLLFVSAFGSSESQYDIDGNGAVDFTDFLMFVQVFGKTVN